MIQGEKIIETTINASNSTDLAIESTMLAHERILLAWVRTAISMISFGFTIYKFFQERVNQYQVTKDLLHQELWE